MSERASEAGLHSAFVGADQVQYAPASVRGKTLPDVVAGRYRIERLLGVGGMGCVYRARDLLHEQFGDPAPLVALKFLADSLDQSPDGAALLYSEFALTRHLNHPNVVRLYTFEVDTDCQRAFISMELMQGLTLDRLLCEHPLGVPWNMLRSIALPLLDAVVHAHRRGVLHADLKPSNVMLCDDGPRLFDFGLGQAEEGMPGLARLSRARFNAWTPGYAAAELLEGAAPSACSDVFALACVLYELAGGKHPYRRLPATQARAEGLERELRAPNTLPRHCWSALRTALALDASRRTMTASDLHAALSRVPFWRARWQGRWW